MGRTNSFANDNDNKDPFDRPPSPATPLYNPNSPEVTYTTHEDTIDSQNNMEATHSHDEDDEEEDIADYDAYNARIPMPNDDDEEDDEDASLDMESITSSQSSQRGRFYNWRFYVPATCNPWHLCRWFMVGGGAYAAELDEEAMQHSLEGLAQCLRLLRAYLELHGMPTRGGAKDQEYVLREVVRDLYAGGAPLWALEPVMQKAAEGLSGQPNVNWLLFPRKAFIYSPAASATSMFKMERGFNIQKMDAMEKVAVRLATFASNVQAVSNVPAKFPQPHEFLRVARRESTRSLMGTPEEQDPKKLARKILALASREQGLFYFVNSREYGGNNKLYQSELENSLHGSTNHTNNIDIDVDKYCAKNGTTAFMTNGNNATRNVNYKNTTTPAMIMNNSKPPPHHKRIVSGVRKSMLMASKDHPGLLQDFWVVSEEERELFSRLACMEAMRTINKLDKIAADPRNQQNPWLMVVYRVCASAGACAFWFHGGWYDMMIAGVLAVLVALIGTSSILSKQERLVYEVVASFFVGLVAGLIALKWPNHTCFASMAISGVLDILQGFRVIFAYVYIYELPMMSSGMP